MRRRQIKQRTRTSTRARTRTRTLKLRSRRADLSNSPLWSWMVNKLPPRNLLRVERGVRPVQCFRSKLEVFRDGWRAFDSRGKEQSGKTTTTKTKTIYIS